MNFLKDESVITASNDNAVTLTTHRIRANFGNNRDSSLVSIMLEHVSSIQLTTRSYPIFLGIGFFLVVAGAAFSQNSYNQSGGEGLIVAGVIVAILYFFVKQHTCVINSDGGAKIVFTTSGMKREQLLTFIDKIEEAQSIRANLSNKGAALIV